MEGKTSTQWKQACALSPKCPRSSQLSRVWSWRQLLAINMPFTLPFSVLDFEVFRTLGRHHTSRMETMFFSCFFTFDYTGTLSFHCFGCFSSIKLNKGWNCQFCGWTIPLRKEKKTLEIWGRELVITSWGCLLVFAAVLRLKCPTSPDCFPSPIAGISPKHSGSALSTEHFLALGTREPLH